MLNILFKIFLSYEVVKLRGNGLQRFWRKAFFFLSACMVRCKINIKNIALWLEKTKMILSVILIQKIESLIYWKQCLDQIPGWSFQYWFLDNFSSVVKAEKQKIIPSFKYLNYEGWLRGLFWTKKRTYFTVILAKCIFKERIANIKWTLYSCKERGKSKQIRKGWGKDSSSETFLHVE